jgi:hypothetical protein
MKEQILQISDKLRDNKITDKEAKTELCFLFGVSESGFDIKPISMELSEDLKQHLDSIESSNKLAETLISSLGVPEKYFGGHSR